jgi:hypothetical protein
MTNWTEPRTWNIGELVTKAIMDTHLRDNLKHLKERVDARLTFVTAPFTNTGYDGDAKSIGTYTMTANAFNTGIPTAAVALLVTVSVKWAVAGDGNYCNIVNPASGQNCLVLRSHVANIAQDAMGIVPVDGTGQFSVIIGGANASSIIINIWGYISA